MLNRIKIGMRLLIGFSVALMGLIIIAFVGLSGLSSVADNVEILVHDRFPKTIWANDIIDQLNENARVLRNLVLTEDPNVFKKEMDRLPVIRSTINTRIDSLKRTEKNAEGLELMAKLEKIRIDYFEVRQTYLDYVSSGQKDIAIPMLFNEIRKVQNQYFAIINEIIHYENQSVNEAGVQTQETYNSRKLIIFIISGLMVLFVFIGANFITRSITKPINLLNDASQKVAKGVLGVNVEINSNDEMGILATSFNTMSDKITLSEFSLSSHQSL